MDRFAALDELKREWTDRYVKANTSVPELMRFKDLVGRVITVNYNGKAVVDFGDGGWYDITASEDFLTVVDSDEEKKKYNGKANSAQPFPAKM